MKRWLNCSTPKCRWLLPVLLLGVSFCALCLGTLWISPLQVVKLLVQQDTQSAAGRILIFTRLPRLAGGLLAGAALAVAGAIIQAVLGNPLAAPNIIGVNAGAGLAVTLCGVLGGRLLLFQPLAAFCGAFLSVAVVFFLSKAVGASRIALILAGVTISSICSALTDLLISLVPDALNGYSDFRIGGLSGLSFVKLLPSACLILPCLAVSCTLTNELDLLNLGSESAAALGLRVTPMRWLLLGLAAALAGAAVSFAGLIGFVGLIVPHLVRTLWSSESRVVIPCSMLLGGCLLVVCDTLSRTVFAPYEVSVGILLALIGGPFFLWRLFRTKGGHGVA